MLRVLVIFGFSLAVCLGNVVPANKAVLCGIMPRNLLACMGNPRIISESLTAKCNAVSTCDKDKCIFTQAGWLKDNKVDKKKVADYFDTYAADHPTWAAAVTNLKAKCLGDQDLPPQTTLVSCPAVDILHCAFISFVKNVSPAQWVQDERCAYARQYAASCPVCPEECFAAMIPNDSCHACYSLPTTPVA